MSFPALTAALFLISVVAPVDVWGQGANAGPGEGDSASRSMYILGPGDLLTIWALGAEELSDKPYRIDAKGDLELPLLGRIHAAGLSVAELKPDLVKRLRRFVKEPSVAVNVTEKKSQPVSVLGAVNNPGIQQLQGNSTLYEVISSAGGVRPDAGSTIKITRQLAWGRIPLPGARDDSTAGYSVAEVKLRSILDASSPENNIPVRPNDVISVPRAEMVYVIGEVNKAGGYVLNERESVSVLQALSLAGGLNHTAAPGNARILRGSVGKRTELAIDLKRVLSGKSADVPLQGDDILFVPNSTSKGIAMRAIETSITIGTGVIVWRR
jgi:polysaccharide export outer membrane protein